MQITNLRRLQAAPAAKSHCAARAQQQSNATSTARPKPVQAAIRSDKRDVSLQAVVSPPEELLASSDTLPHLLDGHALHHGEGQQPAEPVSEGVSNVMYASFHTTGNPASSRVRKYVLDPASVYGVAAWEAYNKNLSTRPVPTKAFTSFFGFMIGDILAQRMEGSEFFLLRCIRLGAYGLLLDGPIGHQWYKLLDRFVLPERPQSTAAVLLKTAADQIVWAPVMTCVFFAFLELLEGRPDMIMPVIQDKLVKTVVANYVVWPAAHFINFRFVPGEHRIMYNNVIAIFWNLYLSLLTHQPLPEGGLVINTKDILDSVNSAQDIVSQLVSQASSGPVTQSYEGHAILELINQASELVQGLVKPTPGSFTQSVLDSLPDRIVLGPLRSPGPGDI